MKKLQRITLGLALLATLTGGISVSAKSSNKQRTLSGVVQRIDLQARTIEVREQETDRVITVRVPEGTLLRTNSTNQPLMQIERLLPGMWLRGVVAE